MQIGKKLIFNVRLEYLMSFFSKENYLTWYTSIKIKKQLELKKWFQPRVDRVAIVWKYCSVVFSKYANYKSLFSYINIFFNILLWLGISTHDIFVLIVLFTYNDISIYFKHRLHNVDIIRVSSKLLKNTENLYTNSEFVTWVLETYADYL
jgi:hypothetical protein